MSATAMAALGADGLFEADHPIQSHVTIFLERLPESFDGFKIAQLSDFHYDEYFSAAAIRSSVAAVNRWNTDLAVLTGDFVTAPFIGKRYSRLRQQSADDAIPCASLLSELRSRHGSVAVLGNHDWSVDAEQITEILRSRHVKVLRNASSPLEVNGNRIWISGADSFPEYGNVAKTLMGVPQDEPVILLAHEPDPADLICKYPVDLQLSGHSHGGQVRIPLLGAPYLPKLGRKYPRGLRQVGRLQLYTNVGIGTLGMPIRLGCPPEVALITLRKRAV